MKNVRYLFSGCRHFVIPTQSPGTLAGHLLTKYADKIYSVHTEEGEYLEFYCGSKDAETLGNDGFLQRFDGMTVTEKGLPSVLRRYRRRCGLLFGLLAGLFLVYLQSLVVWDIRITGNDAGSDAQILESLEKCGFGVGSVWKKTDIDKIRTKVLLYDGSLSHLAINRAGNVAFVEVGEREIPENELPPSDAGIAADRDCVILRIDADEGTPLFSKGQTVLKGQTLIAPTVIGNNGGEYSNGAKGRAFAVTEESFEVKTALLCTSKSYTGRRAKSFRVRFFGKSLPEVRSPFSYCRFERYDTARETKKLRILDEVTFPLSITEFTEREVVLTGENLDIPSAREAAYEKMYDLLAKELCDAEVLCETFSEEILSDEDAPEDSFFLLRCRVECIRDVGLPAEELTAASPKPPKTPGQPG